jgi:hypothetical protein
MKVEDLARGGVIVLGVAAGALLGFVAGMAYARDPQVLRRTAARYLRGAAQGLEQATLMAAQAREHVADLWAQAREEALAEVDAADFARKSAAAAAPAAAAAAGPAAQPPARRARKAAATGGAQASATRKRPRQPRKAAEPPPGAGPTEVAETP